MVGRSRSIFALVAAVSRSASSVTVGKLEPRNLPQPQRAVARPGDELTGGAPADPLDGARMTAQDPAALRLEVPDPDRLVVARRGEQVARRARTPRRARDRRGRAGPPPPCRCARPTRARCDRSSPRRSGRHPPTPRCAGPRTRSRSSSCAVPTTIARLRSQRCTTSRSRTALELRVGHAPRAARAEGRRGAVARDHPGLVADQGRDPIVGAERESAHGDRPRDHRGALAGGRVPPPERAVDG